jgi:hypothetical protein
LIVVHVIITWRDFIKSERLFFVFSQRRVADAADSAANARRLKNRSADDLANSLPVFLLTNERVNVITPDIPDDEIVLVQVRIWCRFRVIGRASLMSVYSPQPNFCLILLALSGSFPLKANSAHSMRDGYFDAKVRRKS